MGYVFSYMTKNSSTKWIVVFVSPLPSQHSEIGSLMQVQVLKRTRLSSIVLASCLSTLSSHSVFSLLAYHLLVTRQLLQHWTLSIFKEGKGQWVEIIIMNFFNRETKSSPFYQSKVDLMAILKL